MAIPIGGHVDYRVSALKGFMFLGDVYFAPAPLAIDSASSYFETRVGMAYEPVENMRFLIEYRLIFTNFTADTDVRLFNSTLSLGARIGF